MISEVVRQLVQAEVMRQDAKWGDQSHHPDGTNTVIEFVGAEMDFAKVAVWTGEGCKAAFGEGRGSWAWILLEEVFEALEADPNSDHLIEELVQVATVAEQWVAAILRRRQSGYEDRPLAPGEASGWARYAAPQFAEGLDKLSAAAQREPEEGSWLQQIVAVPKEYLDNLSDEHYGAVPLEPEHVMYEDAHRIVSEGIKATTGMLLSYAAESESRSLEGAWWHFKGLGYDMSYIPFRFDNKADEVTEEKHGVCSCSDPGLWTLSLGNDTSGIDPLCPRHRRILGL